MTSSAPLAAGLALAPQGAAAAGAAADAAGVVIRPITDADGAHVAARVLSLIWNADEPDRPVVPAELIRSLAHANAYGGLATAIDRPSAAAPPLAVGVALGFLGSDDRGGLLHSYIAGVTAPYRGRAVGFALKQDQRAWALARGLTRIEWTFDPLVRRNARFNLAKLGASAARFHPDFYGAMADGVNAGDRSDRVVVEWQLDSERAVAASEGRAAPLDPMLDDAMLDEAVARLRVGPSDEPEVLAAATTTTGVAGVELVQIPADIVAMREAAPDLARRWREALRETLGAACAAGARIEGITPDGSYVLRRR